MERFKHILKKAFFLPPLPTVLIAFPSFTMVFCVLGMKIDGVIAYVSYTLSAYAMIITITGFTRIVQAVRRGINRHPLMKKVLAHPLGGRYLTDVIFRAEVSLYPSLVINMLYAIMKMVSGILYESIWFITLAVYYMLLAIMRFLLLYFARKKSIKADITAEFKQYRICGVLLAFMTLALSGMILFIVRQDGGYDYPGILIYVMAMYAFYTMITAVVNVIKFRRHGSPVLSAAKAVNLTSAFVSMLALETAMLNQFGSKDDSLFRQVMTASTGAVICGFVFAMAVYMIIHATRRLRKLERSR
ncbi:MAG: hypothetical protein NC089_03585 [Bacteroides sp.]|nr:hypothetical protein [Bacteroides sp.]MCM1549750.1 hypothetical protein [Clostridium sp.]